VSAAWVVRRLDWCTQAPLYSSFDQWTWTAASGRAFLFGTEDHARAVAAAFNSRNTWRTVEFAAEVHHVQNVNRWLAGGGDAGPNA
jgi:predicted P-loop ATPase/GTPase